MKKPMRSDMGTVRKYTARDLATMPRDSLWAIPDGRIEIVFDDGSLESSVREAIFSAYTWGYCNYFPEAPLFKRHHINGRVMNPTLHLRMMEATFWDTYDAYGGELDHERMAELTIEMIGELYSDMIRHTDAYVTSLSMDDINEVMCHPAIKEANDKVMESASDLSIARAYDTIESVLMRSPEMDDNMLARMCRSNLIKMGQVKQCVGPRGPVTEIDSTLFRYPSREGFVGGLYSIYNSLIESRTASKSLSFTEKPLQETEYFNRKLQLLAGVIHSVYDGDCGTTSYAKWFFRPGHEKFLAGKYYLDEETNTLQKITSASRMSLSGKEILLRSPGHCATTDSQYVCSTCYGEMALSIQRGTNIGHVAATALCKQASQQVLSVKHLDSSTSNPGLILGEAEERYIRVGMDPNEIFFVPALRDCKIELVVRATEVERLIDINRATGVEMLMPTQISNLTEMALRITRPDGRVLPPDLVMISNGSRRSSFSRPMLAYLQKKGWQLDKAGDIVINLDEWDHDEPILVTPRRQENMLDYMKVIEKFLKAGKRSAKNTSTDKSLRDYEDFDGGLYGFYELVSSRLSVNLVHLELLIKSCLIRSSKHRDYRVPLLGNKFEVGRFDSNIFNRSNGNAMAFEHHRSMWANPASYLNLFRQSTPLDEILLPSKE